MKNFTKKIFAFSILTLFSALFSLSAFVTADLPPLLPTGAYAVGLYARDAASSKTLSNRVVSYHFERQTTQKGLSVLVTATDLSDANGSLTAYLDEGVWKFTAEADDYSTPGKDYAAAGEINVSKDFSLIVYFQEVGSVSGEVVDEQNKLVPNAQLEVECVKQSNAQTLNKENLASNENGNFMLRFIPTGPCRITASKNSKTGFVDVALQRGELKQTRITLKNTVNRENNTLNILLIFSTTLTILVFIFFYFKLAGKPAFLKKRETQEKQTPAKKTKQNEFKSLKTTNKMRIVLNALNERERSIVELLLANEGRLKQAKIARELLMPKTSLTRAVQSLEKRNIVKTTPLGKHKIVELTDWFKSL